MRGGAVKLTTVRTESISAAAPEFSTGEKSLRHMGYETIIVRDHRQDEMDAAFDHQYFGGGW